MLVSYDPMSDVLSITLGAAPIAATQMQGTVRAGFDAAGSLVSIAIPEASSVLWEHGGQVNIAAPEPVATIVHEHIVEHVV